MELKTERQAIAVAETLLDAFDERPVDGDFVLPDYCPDMAAILKCTVTPILLDHAYSGDRLTVDGTAWIRVLYLDESRTRVCTYEVSQPFTSNFVSEERRAQTAVQLSVRPEYVNCRAISPRRLDVHGAFRVHAKAVGEGCFEAVGAVEDDDVFVRRRSIGMTVPCGSAQKNFTVSETVEAAEGETVVRTEAVPVLTDVKILPGKVIVKGDLRLKNLMMREADGQTEVRSFTVPFSQMMDVEGLDDERRVEADVRLLSHDVRCESDPTGATALQCATKLLLTATAWREETAEVMVDAYAAYAPLRLERESMTESRLTALERETSTVRQTLELPPEVHRVLDVWCEVEPLSAAESEDRHTIEGRLTVHLLAAEAEGPVGYYERTADFSLDFPKKGTAETDRLSVIGTEYTVSADRGLELSVTLLVCRACREENTVSVVTGVYADEERYPAEKSAVKVIFAEAGESLWEIAKRCHTSAEQLMRENDLTEDRLTQACTLLVPIGGR